MNDKQARFLLNLSVHDLTRLVADLFYHDDTVIAKAAIKLGITSVDVAMALLGRVKMTAI